MSFTFTPGHEARFNTLKARYPDIKALSLPSLWMAQYQDGYISSDAMHYIANRLRVSPAEIYAIASFYTMFKLKPIGHYHIELCKTLSCNLCGSKALLDHLKNRYGILPGETSKDGKFTLSLVECLGACGGAPMISLNEVYYEDLTPEKLDAILKELS